MAKILLVCDKVTTTSWQLAQALISQQHQVTFLTSFGETVENTHHVDFMAYFKKWSSWEALRLIPTLFRAQFQIFHFVLDTDTATPAHLALWGFIHSQRNAVFTLSLLHIERGLTRKNTVRYLIQQSDIVTCPSVDSLAHLRGLEVKSTRQGRTVLPPVLPFHENHFISDEISEFQELLKEERYLIRPFNEPHFDPTQRFFQELVIALKHYQVVLLGSQDHWTVRDRKRFQQWLVDAGVSGQWFLTGQHTLDEATSLFKGAEAIWLADLDLPPMELTDYFLKALDTNSTLLLDSKQARLHAPLWRHGQNCWIQAQNTLEELLTKQHLKLTYEMDRTSVERKDLVDAPLNELNRLYNKALSQKALL